MSSDQIQGPLVDAATSVLKASLPGEGTVSRSALDTLIAADPRALGTLPASVRRVVRAAMIRARVYTASANEALELAEYEAQALQRTTGAELPPSTRSACHSVLSEAFLVNGLSTQGNRQARLADDYAAEADDDACRFRAAALLACNLALNGEFERARQSSIRASAWAEKHRWTRNTSVLPLDLADMLIAYAHMDDPGLEAVCDRLALTPGQGPIWIAFGQLANGWLHMMRQQYGRALVCAERLTGGSDAALLPRLITGFGLGLQSMALIHRGEPHRALSLLAGQESPGGHALCFDLQRSTAHLQLGDNREALLATEACVRMGRDHNLRTLPAILMRRALASDRLGHHVVADNAFSEAFMIMAGAGALTPLLGLPADEMEGLLVRMLARHPELSTAAARLRLDAQGFPRTVTTEFRAPHLTSRESIVASQLRSALTISEIAAQLHVSRNTLKSQLRSLYVKLGASTRAQAVLRLERCGFYDRSRAGAD